MGKQPDNELRQGLWLKKGYSVGFDDGDAWDKLVS